MRSLVGAAIPRVDSTTDLLSLGSDTDTQSPDSSWPVGRLAWLPAFAGLRRPLAPPLVACPKPAAPQRELALGFARAQLLRPTQGRGLPPALHPGHAI